MTTKNEYNPLMEKYIENMLNIIILYFLLIGKEMVYEQEKS